MFMYKCPPPPGNSRPYKGVLHHHHPIIPKFNKADWGGTLIIPMINQWSFMDTRLIIIPI